MSYYASSPTAGHDTTSATISGGMHALIEHPDQLARLRANPELMPLADRGDGPLGHSGQGVHAHGAEDTEVRGVPIAAGRIGAAVLCRRRNRDEDVFDDPFRFDVGRDPNKHNAFGYGVHFCLGAALARMEVNSFFSELVPRLESIELTGDPAHSRRSSSAGSSTCRSATRSSELTDGRPGHVEDGRPAVVSDRERNPDPEEIEAPLVVTRSHTGCSLKPK